MSEIQNTEAFEKNRMSLQKDLATFIGNNFDQFSKKWKVDESILESRAASQVPIEPEILDQLIAGNKQFIKTQLKLTGEDTIRLRQLTMSEACQLEVRRLKSNIQWHDEFLLAKTGTTEQIVRLTPLVLRRVFKSDLADSLRSTQKDKIDLVAHHSQEELFNAFVSYGVQTVLDSKDLVYYDGDQFTFLPEEMQEVEYAVCNCPDDDPNSFVATVHNLYDIQNGKCPNPVSNKVLEFKSQLKHNIGNWNCKACLVDGGNATIAGGSKEQYFTKATKWCPNFALGGVGATLAKHGVEKYREVVKATADATLCFAGIMHVQMTPMENGAQMDYKCDTCGLKISEFKPAAIEVETNV